MSSPAEQLGLVLIQRLADGRVVWIPLGVPPHQVAATPEAAYTLIDRGNYEAPQTLVAQRAGDDLVVQVQSTQVLVLDGFFITANVAFYPTTSITSGAGPFSGAPLTPDSPVPAASTAGEQVVWSADADEKTAADHDEISREAGGGSSPMLWVGVAAGGVGLLALGAAAAVAVGSPAAGARPSRVPRSRTRSRRRSRPAQSRQRLPKTAARVKSFIRSPPPTLGPSPTASNPVAMQRHSASTRTPVPSPLTGEPGQRGEAQLRVHCRGHRRGPQQQ